MFETKSKSTRYLKKISKYGHSSKNVIFFKNNLVQKIFFIMNKYSNRNSNKWCIYINSNKKNCIFNKCMLSNILQVSKILVVIKIMAISHIITHKNIHNRIMLEMYKCMQDHKLQPLMTIVKWLSIKFKKLNKLKLIFLFFKLKNEKGRK